jgi:hypothetical protein
MKFTRRTWTVVGVAAAMLLVPAGVSFAVAEATIHGQAAVHAPAHRVANPGGNGNARMPGGRAQGRVGNVGPGMMGRQGQLGGQQGTRQGGGLRGGQQGAPTAPRGPAPANTATPSAN